MNLDDERASYDKQLEYLSAVIERMEGQMITADERLYLRQRKLADENAAWLWKMVKTHAPWIATCLGLIGSAVYALLTNTITISVKK